MPELPNPYLLIQGRRLLPEGANGATAAVAALANVVITWGQDTLTDDPQPATLAVTLRYHGSTDVLHVAQGDLIELQQQHPDGVRSAFSGRVRSMSAELDRAGRLLLHLTATDHLADLDGSFISTAWPADGTAAAEGRTVRQRIIEAITAAGWSITGLDQLPPEAGRSAATYYNSIKLTTLLRRYLSQWGPQATFYDASYTDPAGRLVRRLAVTYMADTAPGDTLSAGPDGTWAIEYGEPAPAAQVAIPAANVLRDVAWDSGPENLYTSARVSRQVTRREEYEDGSTAYVTALAALSVGLSYEAVDRYGIRTIELETLTGRSREADADLHRAIGRKWLAFNGAEWRPGALTVHDSTRLPPAQLSAMVDSLTRPRQWIVVPGVQVMTPRGAPAALRGLSTGGTLSWDHPRQRWAIAMALADTQRTTGRAWTFADLAAHPDPAISGARAEQAGTVQFASFDTIAQLGELTP